MYKHKRSFYIPENATEIKDPTSDAVVYIFKDKKDRLSGVAFHGKAQKPDWSYYWVKEEDAAERIHGFFDARRSHLAWKKEQRAKVQGMKRKLQVGHILRSMWGYEQTNIDYYEVVALKGKKSVVLRKIAAQNVGDTGYMQGQCVPCPGEYIGEPFTKRISAYDGSSVRLNSYSSAFLWEGRVDEWTAYH